MPPSRAIAVCAVSVMAMVFSVQQGEHGPLVVYKLKVPEASGGMVHLPETPAPAVQISPLLGTPPLPEIAVPLRPVPVPAPGLGSAPATYRPGPLQPKVLGTVVLPAAAPHPAAPLYPAPAPGHDIEPPKIFEIVAPDYQPSFRVVSDALTGEAMINEETGELLTLDEVNDAIIWRRNTVEKLRQVPIGPRF